MLLTRQMSVSGKWLKHKFNLHVDAYMFSPPTDEFKAMSTDGFNQHLFMTSNIPHWGMYQDWHNP